MSKKRWRRLLSLGATAALLVSILCVTGAPAAAATADDIRAAAEAYVRQAQNSATKEGLLEAVKKAAPDAAIANDEDFFIKHAVNGVKDEMEDGSENEYPLDIPGSDGAVAAVFTVGSEKIGVTVPFAHQTEILKIKKVAVVGTDTNFTIEGKNVTGYTGDADKIVYPSGTDYVPTQWADLTAAKKVKAVVYGTSGKIASNYPFANWESLIAFQCEDSCASNLTSDPLTDYYIFAGCAELKYFRFPGTQSTIGWSGKPAFGNSLLANCAKLETVVLPTVFSQPGSSVPYRCFYGTAVREFVFPENIASLGVEPLGNPTYTGGTRNTIFYADDMTGTRALALVAAKLNELLRDPLKSGAAVTALADEAKAAVSGAHNADTLKGQLTIAQASGAVSNAAYDGGALTLGITGGASVSMGYARSKALTGLETGYRMTPAFSADETAYAVTVPNETTRLDVTYTEAPGVKNVQVNGGTDLAVGSNTVTVAVTTASDETVTYTLTVTRQKAADQAAVIRAAAEAYVRQAQNDATKDGLIQAVQAEVPGASLADGDFFIKHAVNGVRDVMKDGSANDYPLDIPGSDGAVAAIFAIDGARVGVAVPIPHQTEIIEIEKVDVFSDSNTNFTFTRRHWDNTWVPTTITGYTGNADKIVFPNEGDNGFGQITFADEASKTAANHVKVLINNSSTVITGTNTFKGWEGLVAVQWGENDHKGQLVNGPNAADYSSNNFSDCPNLKYVRLPKQVGLDQWALGCLCSTDMFKNCPKLENVILPEKVTNGASQKVHLTSGAFVGTAVRDFFLPEGVEQENPDALPNGAQSTLYTTDMTDARALALAAAKFHELSVQGETDPAALLAGAKAAVSGAHNAEALRGEIRLNAAPDAASDLYVGGRLTLGLGGDSLSMEYAQSKALTGIETGYRMTPAFSAKETAYAITVPNDTTALTVTPAKAEGVKNVKITGADALKVGENTVQIEVTTAADAKVTYTLTVTRLKGSDQAAAVQAAAKAYILKEQNNVTRGGLLMAVQEAVPGAALAEEDFFIKHAVNGVKDVLKDGGANDYPLNIPGSDGAVAAVFTLDGARIGVAAPIASQTEIVYIGKVAVAGVSDGFTYDADDPKVVTGYTGDADKLVYPSAGSAAGAYRPIRFTDAAAKAAANKVKVVIYNSEAPIKTPGDSPEAKTEGAFKGWESLIAVQCGDTHAGELVENPNDRIGTFAGCPNLKYVKLPRRMNNPGWTPFILGPNAFDGCAKLETVILPEEIANANTQIPYGAFTGTAVRDFFFPENIVGLGAPDKNMPAVPSTSQTFLYSQTMSDVRALALVAAKFQELTAQGGSLDDLLAGARGAVTGAKNAEALRGELRLNAKTAADETLYTDGALTLGIGSDSLSVDYTLPKALASLDTGYRLTPAFSAKETAYAVKVPNETAALSVNAVPAAGASGLTVTGADALKVGENEVKIAVTTAAGQTVEYTLTVTRVEPYTLDGVEALLRETAANAAWDNSTTQAQVKADLEEALAITGYTLEIQDFYKYKAIGGAKEGGEILVAGHNGSIALVVKAAKGGDSRNISLFSVIDPPYKTYTFAPEEVSKEEDFVISEDGETLEWYSGDAKKVVIPDGVKYIDIGWYDGDHPDQVVAIVMPDTVEEIPEAFCTNFHRLEVCRLSDRMTAVTGSAFQCCYFLQYVHMPERLEIISANAFLHTLALHGFYIPESVFRIGGNAFWGSGVRDITLPSKLEDVGVCAFAYPNPTAAVWNNSLQQGEPVPNAEEAVRLQAVMDAAGISSTDRTITIIGTNLLFTSGNFCTGDESHRLGARVIVRASDEAKEQVFGDALNEHTTYEWGLDMTAAEAAARVQNTADHLVVTVEDTADSVMDALRAALESQNVTLTWKEAFAVAGGARAAGQRATGVVTVTDGRGSFDIAFDRAVQEVREDDPTVPTNPTNPSDTTTEPDPTGGETGNGNENGGGNNPGTGVVPFGAAAITLPAAAGAVVLLRKKRFAGRTQK